MESTPRSAWTIAHEFEQRLENLRTNTIHDDRTLSNFESLLNQCSNQLTQISSSTDSTLICIVLPALFRTIIALTKISSDKSELSQEKFIAFITNAKTLYNQIKEFLKSNKLNTVLIGSIHLRHFCEQIHQISDSAAHIDNLLTFICQKLIVKLLTGGDDPQQVIDHSNDDLTMIIYGSILPQLNMIATKYFVDAKGGLYLRVMIFNLRDFLPNIFS